MPQLLEGLLKAANCIRPALPHRIKRPVFVIAPPRSGSSFLFEALAQFREFTTFTYREAEHIWWEVLPYSERRDRSDAIGRDDLGWWKRRRVTSRFYSSAVATRPGARYVNGFVGLRPIRYLDKTISNCFHLDLLQDMYPDAQFVYLVRDPRGNIASMLEGWAHADRFGKAQLQPYLDNAGLAVPHWSYPAPPGWTKLSGCDLAQVCAWSWRQHTEAIAEFRARNNRGILLTYEELIADPAAVVGRLCAPLGLSVTAPIRDYLENPPLSRTAITAPRADKWRDVQQSLDRVMPSVRDAAALFGYCV